MFGRKGLGSTPPTAPRPVQDGRAWVDARLAQYERPGSMEFAQALGLKLFDAAYHAMKDERGVRIEAIVAMLASVGGFFCIHPVVRGLKEQGLAPSEIGMKVVQGADGRTYLFGDAPNRLLAEHPMSLISLVFGAAHQHGGKVSVEMMTNEMAHVASRVGSGNFWALDLPERIDVGSPLDWVTHFTPFVLDTVSAAFVADLERQGMTGLDQLPATAKLPPEFLLHRIVAFAIQQAIDVGHQALDPTLIANLALQCAVRTAKLDPASLT